MSAITAKILPLLIIVVSTLSLRTTADAADAPPAEQLEKLAPHASGIALVEVVSLKEVDGRPGDGSLDLVVKFEILRATGTTIEQTSIIIARGGGGQPSQANAKPAPPGPVKLDTFKKGERYWIAICSYYDDYEYPQLIVKSWPEKDASKLLEEAVRADLYAHQPQYDPRTGLTHSHRTEKDNSGWQVRMDREGKLLWEVTLPGEKYPGATRYTSSTWRLLNLDHWPYCLEHADRTKTNWYLFAESVVSLEKANPYQLPEGKHRVVYVLDAETGKTASVRVTKSAGTGDAAVVHFHDLNTGKLRREERTDHLSTGGVAAGAKEEGWLRRIVRTFDLPSGTLKSEAILRYAGGSTYVPVSNR